tara:strand:+ start:3553 stop:4581 length:1029 start_codon:yes stop_codon:yes gene_type:complete
MVEIIHFAALAIFSFLLSTIFTGFLIRGLIIHKVMDIPNERSSHNVSVPRGGGITVLCAIVVGWLLDDILINTLAVADLVILSIAALLGVICFIDDMKGMSPYVKLFFQVAGVVSGIYLLFPEGGIFGRWFPISLDLLLTGIIWLWFINLFNFMDGIDGITGTEMLTLGLGMALLSGAGILNPSVLSPSLVIAAAALGFLVWNWSPAKIFMGDVGSIPIGYLIGWLLISAAVQRDSAEYSIAAIIILPGYYLADSTFTVVFRILKGENILLAHRQHFYQKAVDRGISHGTVCYGIAAVNLFLLITAWLLTTTYPFIAMLIGSLLVGFVLLWMRGLLYKICRF